MPLPPEGCQNFRSVRRSICRPCPVEAVSSVSFLQNQHNAKSRDVKGTPRNWPELSGTGRNPKEVPWSSVRQSHFGAWPAMFCPMSGKAHKWSHGRHAPARAPTACPRARGAASPCARGCHGRGRAPVRTLLALPPELLDLVCRLQLAEWMRATNPPDTEDFFLKRKWKAETKQEAIAAATAVLALLGHVPPLCHGRETGDPVDARPRLPHMRRAWALCALCARPLHAVEHVSPQPLEHGGAQRLVCDAVRHPLPERANPAGRRTTQYLKGSGCGPQSASSTRSSARRRSHARRLHPTFGKKRM